MCGIIINSSCSGEWCFEEVNSSNSEQCLEGLSRWQENENTSISYGVYFNSTSDNTPDKAVSLHVQVASYNQYNKNCPNNVSWIGYNITCNNSDNSATQVTNLWENYTRCEWNVSLTSSFGCVATTEISSNSSNSPTSFPTASAEYTGSNSNQLSTGSILVIMLSLHCLSFDSLSTNDTDKTQQIQQIQHRFVVVLLTYLILGCAYNSFYHGRVGIDAIPNKSGWSQLWRYFKAGCETTYDTVCCHQGNIDYQNL